MMQCKAKSENFTHILGYQIWAVTSSPHGLAAPRPKGPCGWPKGNPNPIRKGSLGGQVSSPPWPPLGLGGGGGEGRGNQRQEAERCGRGGRSGASTARTGHGGWGRRRRGTWDVRVVAMGKMIDCNSPDLVP